jgi:superfamily I DNA/RNA helicase
MTIHKSKGLEYHTVIFVGLDDGAWWSFAEDQIEGTAGFFVAFTRAKQRVLFTYCASRGTRAKIATLYELLLKAGVQIVQRR